MSDGQYDALLRKVSELEAKVDSYEEILGNTRDPVRVILRRPEVKEFGVPVYRHAGDAGVDLHCILDEEDRKPGLQIFPGERKLIDTGLNIEFPKCVWGEIVHRSSTERRHRLRIVSGTIDNGYQGKLFAQVSNDNTFPIKVQHGDRVAQLRLFYLVRRDFVQVESFDSVTTRAASGFGSTGR